VKQQRLLRDIVPAGGMPAVAVLVASTAIEAAARLSTPVCASRLVEYASVLVPATASVGRLDGLVAATMSNGTLQNLGSASA
jgi:hypothetical protein